MAWESNYRGSLGFLRQARAQQATRGLVAGRGRLAVLRARLEQMMADVFDIPMPPETVRKLVDIAAEVRSA